MNTISSFSGENEFLSNFFPSPVMLDGMQFPTVEHAYQASKTLNIQERQNIQSLATPGKAKRAGRKTTLRPDWSSVRINIMRDLLEQKFTDPQLKQKLLNTTGSIIVEENNWHDNFWGMCQCENCGNTGENNLGQLLMEIREELEIR